MPASGYYEWIGTPAGKQPFYFTRTDGQPITFAAIQDAWNNPETGEPIRSCSMVIGEANDFVSKFHDRMPIILEQKDFEQWERGSIADATALMKPAADGIIQAWPVSMAVNSSRTPGDDAPANRTGRTSAGVKERSPIAAGRWMDNMPSGGVPRTPP